MPRRRNPVREATILACIYVFYHLTRLLPLGLCRALGKAIGRLAYLLVPRLKRVGLDNLRLAYGDSLSPAEERRILVGAAENLGLVAVEFSRLPWLRTAKLDSLARLEGLEEVDLSRSLLGITGHVANWEWGAAIMARFDYQVAAVVRPLDNPWLNALVDRTRRAGGIHTLPKDEAGRELFKLLREGWLLGLLADQSPRENGVPATFFGAPCWATIAPMMIALRAKVPVHPVSMVREPSGSYVLRFHPAIPLERTGDLRRDLLVNTQRFQDAIEAMVRAHPEQWLWFHRRWKTRPRLEAEWAARQRKVKRHALDSGQE